MSYYTKTWTVYRDGKRVNIIFLTKKSATEWIDEQIDAATYTIEKESMN